MVRTLVRAHTLLTQSDAQPTVVGGAIAVEDGMIRRVGPLAALEREGPYDTVIGDPERHLAFPGLVNGHHHTLRPARLELGAAPLERWLVRQRLRQLPPLSADEVYDHTLWGTLQFLKSGVTAVVDHYPFDARLEDLGVPASVQAYRDAGVRAALCIACQDQQRVVYEDEETFLATLPPDLADPLRERLRPFDQDAFFALWDRLAARFDGQDGRIRLGFGPGGPQWCSDGLLRRLRRVADEHDHAPVQIHLLESRFQALYGYRRYGHSVVRHLVELGFFGPATSCAHCVWVGREDIALLADAGAVAVHNPSSNALLFNGISPVVDLLDGGARVGFGLDAAGLNDTQDALTDLRLGLVLQRQAGWDRRQLTAADMLALATHGGAPTLGMDVALGRLEAGYQADVVLVDRTRLYGSPYVSPLAPPEEVVLRRATAADVEHVLVGGRLVVEGGTAVGIDEAALQRRVAQSLEHTYGLLAATDRFFERLDPYVAAFYRRWETESGDLLPPNYVINTR
jgi:5-methylthioadenosine/S-adenosylhomocysteine deaminase